MSLENIINPTNDWDCKTCKRTFILYPSQKMNDLGKANAQRKERLSSQLIKFQLFVHAKKFIFLSIFTSIPVLYHRLIHMPLAVLMLKLGKIDVAIVRCKNNILFVQQADLHLLLNCLNMYFLKRRIILILGWLWFSLLKVLKLQDHSFTCVEMASISLSCFLNVLFMCVLVSQ